MAERGDYYFQGYQLLDEFEGVPACPNVLPPRGFYGTVSAEGIDVDGDCTLAFDGVTDCGPVAPWSTPVRSPVSMREDGRIMLDQRTIIDCEGSDDRICRLFAGDQSPCHFGRRYTGDQVRAFAPLATGPYAVRTVETLGSYCGLIDGPEFFADFMSVARSDSEFVEFELEHLGLTYTCFGGAPDDLSPGYWCSSPAAPDEGRFIDDIALAWTDDGRAEVLAHVHTAHDEIGFGDVDCPSTYRVTIEHEP